VYAAPRQFGQQIQGTAGPGKMSSLGRQVGVAVNSTPVTQHFGNLDLNTRLIGVAAFNGRLQQHRSGTKFSFQLESGATWAFEFAAHAFDIPLAPLSVERFRFF